MFHSIHSAKAQEDVFAVLEDVLPPIFAEYGKYNIASTAPFRRIAYNDALETYGTDKPDLRIDLTAQDVTDLLGETEFDPFRSGNVSKAVPISGCELTRKQIDKIITDVEVQSGKKPYWFRMDESGAFVGGVAKFLDPVKDRLIECLGLKPGTLVVISS